MMTQTRSPSDIGVEVTHTAWKAAIRFLRYAALNSGYQTMTGPEALTEAANAMELAMKEPWVKNG